MAYDYSSGYPSLEDLTADQNVYNLPAFQIETPNDGIPQAPWWSPIITAATNVGIGFANKELYGSPGTTYTGPAPYITLGNGQVIRNTAIKGAATGINSTVLLIAAAAALFIFARR